MQLVCHLPFRHTHLLTQSLQKITSRDVLVRASKLLFSFEDCSPATSAQKWVKFQLHSVMCYVRTLGFVLQLVKTGLTSEYPCAFSKPYV